MKLFNHYGQLWALKSNGGWTIDESDKAHETALRLDLSNETSNVPISELGGNLLLGAGAVLLQYSSALTTVDPKPGQGLPTDRVGVISALQLLNPARLAVAIDAAQRESSVLVLQDGAWHELMRAPEPGARILGLALQECPGARSRLWIDLGGDLAFVELPLDSESPLGDAGLSYQHEAVLVSGIVDMGAALLPKFLKQFTLWSANLARGLQVNLDYQIDEEIGSSQWRNAGAFYSSPLDSLPLQVGPLHTIRVRLRLLTNQATLPPVVNSIVMEGFARTPLKYQWTLRVRLADLQADYVGGLDPSPDAFIAWLQDAARQARKIQMRSVWQALDDKNVIVEPPAVKREYIDGTQWGGVATVVLREA